MMKVSFVSSRSNRGGDNEEDSEQDHVANIIRTKTMKGNNKKSMFDSEVIHDTLERSKMRMSKAKIGAQRAWGQMRKTMGSKTAQTLTRYSTGRSNGDRTVGLKMTTTGKGKNRYDKIMTNVEYDGDQAVDRLQAEERIQNLMGKKRQDNRRDEVFDMSLEVYEADGSSKRSGHNSVYEMKTDANSAASESNNSSGLDLKMKLLRSQIPRIRKTDEERTVIMKSLKKNVFFQELAEEDMHLIADAMEIQTFEENDTICAKGEMGDTFYMLKSGRVMVSFEGETHDAEIGDSFDEFCLLYTCPRERTIVALNNAECFSLSRTVYKRIVAISENDRLSSTKLCLQSVAILKSFTKDQISEIAECVHLVKFERGTPIIVKGTIGNIFYFIKSGSVSCTKIGDDEKLMDVVLGEGEYFGERALLKDEPRAANVIAIEEVECLALDRESFELHLGSLADILNKNLALRVLKSMPLLHELNGLQLGKLCDALEIKDYAPGTQLIEQGTKNKNLFIIIKGKVEITVFNNSDREKHTKISDLTDGEYFGESALQSTGVSNAEVTTVSEVRCYVLDARKHIRLLKPIAKTLRRNQTLRKKRTAEAYRKNSVKFEQTIQLEDLEVHATLGTGTFGRVRLVEHKRTGNTYALKILQKTAVVQYKQQTNVMNEKTVMLKSNHPFILKLHRTFKTKNCLYFLLEYVPGGELFSLLYLKGGFLEPNHARFYAACVIDAVVYLHKRQIVYRDLKPENLMIDREGYIRMVDFGFAKKVTTRTYTLCGTPDYLSPESIKGVGHNRAVDYWAIGVLIYEMIAGFSPFSDAEKNSQDEIFERILRGKFGFTSSFTSDAKHLVKKLIVLDFRERLGMFKAGPDEIKSHTWFRHLDWDELLGKSVTAPWIPTIESDLDTKNFDSYDEDDTEIPYKGSNKPWANF